MFTGIIETIGKISKKTNNSLFVQSTLKNIKLGESIAVNGVCLTVADHISDTFRCDVSHESAKKASFSELRSGTFVNLERALKVGDSLGGHFLQGHVETTSKILKIQSKNSFFEITFELPAKIKKYVIEKGSIGVDGISLTIASITDNSIMVAVIPHTFKTTNLKTKRTGSLVNLESDMYAKYIENIMKYQSHKTVLTNEFLTKNGF